MKNFPIDPHCKNCSSVVESNWNFASEFVKNLQMIEVSLSLIERDFTKISPNIRLHWDMRRTVETGWLTTPVTMRPPMAAFWPTALNSVTNVIRASLSVFWGTNWRGSCGVMGMLLGIWKVVKTYYPMLFIHYDTIFYIWIKIKKTFETEIRFFYIFFLKIKRRTIKTA